MNNDRCPFCDATIIEGEDTHAIGCPHEDPWDDEPSYFDPQEFADEEDSDESQDDEDTDHDLKPPFG